MHRVVVLDDDHVLALQTADAQLRAGCGGVGEQALAELGVEPGARRDASAEVGADLVLVDLGEAVDGVGGHDAPLDRQRLERLHRAAISSSERGWDTVGDGSHAAK